MNDSPAVLAGRLRERWSRLLPEAEDIGDDVVSRYADPARVYHDVRHLRDVLSAVDLLGEEGPDPEAVELAAWFHDAVYDVTRSDNEAASADLARSLLAPYRDDGTVSDVVRLVLLTRDHRVEPGDPNGAVLCDADLAVLGRDPAAYDEYAALVRREYAQVPDEAFRTGRAAVLQALLALPTLFSTRYGLRHWETPARANLTRELTSLSPP